MRATELVVELVVIAPLHRSLMRSEVSSMPKAAAEATR